MRATCIFDHRRGREELALRDLLLLNGQRGLIERVENVDELEAVRLERPEDVECRVLLTRVLVDQRDTYGVWSVSYQSEWKGEEEAKRLTALVPVGVVQGLVVSDSNLLRAFAVTRGVRGRSGRCRANKGKKKSRDGENERLHDDRGKQG